MQGFPHLGTGIGLRPPHYADVAAGRAPRRLARGDQRELHGRGRQPAARAARGARALPDRAARRLDVARVGGSARRALPGRAGRAGARDRARLDLGSPLLVRLRRPLRPRPVAAALHGGGAATTSRARVGACPGTARPPHPGRERVQLPHVPAFDDDRVGVPGGARRARRLRPAAGRQQRVRQRAQPRLRSDRVPRRRAARRASGSSTSPATATRGPTCSTRTTIPVCDEVWALYRQAVAALRRASRRCSSATTTFRPLDELVAEARRAADVARRRGGGGVKLGRPAGAVPRARHRARRRGGDRGAATRRRGRPSTRWSSATRGCRRSSGSTSTRACTSSASTTCSPRSCRAPSAALGGEAFHGLVTDYLQACPPEPPVAARGGRAAAGVPRDARARRRAPVAGRAGAPRTRAPRGVRRAGRRAGVDRVAARGGARALRRAPLSPDAVAPPARQSLRDRGDLARGRPAAKRRRAPSPRR